MHSPGAGFANPGDAIFACPIVTMFASLLTEPISVNVHGVAVAAVMMMHPGALYRQRGPENTELPQGPARVLGDLGASPNRASPMQARIEARLHKSSVDLTARPVSHKILSRNRCTMRSSFYTDVGKFYGPSKNIFLQFLEL